MGNNAHPDFFLFQCCQVVCPKTSACLYARFVDRMFNEIRNQLKYFLVMKVFKKKKRLITGA